MTVGAVVVAAGSGTRLGARVPKALVPLAGAPLVRHAVDGLVTAGITAIVVVAPEDECAAVAALLDDLGPGVTVVAGGAQRSDSVRAGLAALPAVVDVVAVHDAARALTPPTVIRQVVAAVVDDVVAAAPGLPVADTLKRVDGDTIVATVDRSDLVGVQTPQVFRREVLEAAHAGQPDATDDLALVEEAGTRGRIVVTAGSPLAMKITFPHDLQVAEALLAARP